MSIIKRYNNNPILTKDDVPYPVATVHNAAVDDVAINIYWGCADTVMSMSAAKIDALVNLCLNNSKKAL